MIHVKRRQIGNLVGRARNYHLLPGFLPAQRVPQARLFFAIRTWRLRARKRPLGALHHSNDAILGAVILLSYYRQQEPFRYLTLSIPTLYPRPMWRRQLGNKLLPGRS